ncbi:hypothetical protein LP419_21425 [Massilia sp. H-1]|nr:hypothetical protein LP419_21425 [Massilia sp. H-1]
MIFLASSGMFRVSLGKAPSNLTLGALLAATGFLAGAAAFLGAAVLVFLVAMSILSMFKSMDTTCLTLIQ